MQSYQPHHPQPYHTYSHPLPSHYPSVFESTHHILDTSPLSLDGYSSFIMPESPTLSHVRRQRVSMACRYCRHRKIRCCGGNPCKNCTKAGKECDYAPVPEEVNKATRAKKAASKAAKQPHAKTASASYTAYIHPGHPGPIHVVQNMPSTNYYPSPVYHPAHGGSVPAPSPARPVYLAHRRASSTPNNNLVEMGWQSANNVPPMATPPMFDSVQGDWSFNQSQSQSLSQIQTLPQPHTAPIPQQSTFEYVQHPQAPYPHQTIPGQQNSQLPTSYSTPNMQQSAYLQPIHPVTPIGQQHQQYNPHHVQSQIKAHHQHSDSQRSNTTHSTSTNGSSPTTPAPAHYYGTQGGYPTPVYSPMNLQPTSRNSNNSPTLAPEYSLSQQKDPLVGLGIGFGMGTTSSHSQSSSSISHDGVAPQDMSLGLNMIEDTFYTSPYVV